MDAEQARWEGFGLRAVRQSVFVRFPDRAQPLSYPGMETYERGFEPGDVLPIVEEDGERSWRIVETERREWLGSDEAIERVWLLTVAPL